MNVELINFFGAKNVEFEEFREVEGAELPVFFLTDLSAEEWNQKARIQNTRMFVEMHGRQPAGYQEVKSWINDDRKEEIPSAATLGTPKYNRD